MATVATIPVSISQEAAGHVVRLGLWSGFEAMLDHTKQDVPGVQSIEVSLEYHMEGCDPVVAISAYLKYPYFDAPGPVRESVEVRWDRWALETFSPHVTQHFCLIVRQGTCGHPVA